MSTSSARRLVVIFRRGAARRFTPPRSVKTCACTGVGFGQVTSTTTGDELHIADGEKENAHQTTVASAPAANGKAM